MKKLFYFVVLCGILLCGCVREKAVRIEKHNGEDLYVCDYFKVSDSTTVLKLSDLVQSLEVVKLDNDTSATVGNGMIRLSDNYILIRAGHNLPFKLFTRGGKYLCDIGKIGRGPGEYTTVYDVQLDEKNKSIFLMPWQSSALHKYNFEGDYHESMRLVSPVPKGCFNVQDNLITVQALPFKGLKWIAYQQTFDGKLVDSVSAKPFEIRGDFSNEIYCDRYNSSFFVFLWEGKQDTLYHYKPGTNSLTPKFTVNYGNIEVPIHDYHEVGNYFWFTTSTVVQTGEHTFTNKPDKNVLVNKKTLQASRFKFINDLMGGYDASLWCLGDGYYVESVDPLKLKEKLEKVLEKGIENKAIEKRVTDLMNSIDENDNNYVLLGKLK